MGFCLFGVFGLDGGERVEVVSPRNCKTDCPACARVCPNVAIIFPKYGKGPINGDQVREEDARHEPVKVDVSSLFAQGVRSSLRARTKDAGEQSSAETVGSEASEGCECRRRKLQADLDIPDKVLEEIAMAGNTGDGTEHPDVNVADHQPRISKTGGQRFTPSGNEWDL
jgi:ferredoxin